MAAVPDLRRFVLEGERLTILNGLRFALAINSGIFIFIRAMPDGLRAVRHCIFTERVIKKNGIIAGFDLLREKRVLKSPQAFQNPNIKE